MYVTGFLGRHPRSVGTVAGCSMAVIMIIVFCFAGLGLRIQQVEAGHQRVLDRMRAVMFDASKLLTELNANYQPECSQENLRMLSALVFTHRYIRGIGLINEQGLLFCSTGMGRLPIARPPSGQAIDGSIGRYYLHTPVQRFVGPVPGKVAGTVVERGRFQVLIDSATTLEAFAEFTDVVWAGGGEQRRRIYSGENVEATDAFVAADTPPLRVDWARFHLHITETLQGISPISVQSVLGLHTIGDGRLRVMVVVIAFFALFGFVSAGSISRRCREYQSIDYRIRALCNADNVVCHYQPILELASGRMVGCEVLARLRDGGKLLYPDQFIPALNKQHLGWVFDAAVSRAALLELAAALPPQTRFAVALNFFPHNLKRDAIHAHLHAVLAEIDRTDLQIELEVTEYDFSPDLAPELRRLKADGYGISIDDFGTGYSNLGIVKKVSPDYLKIDRSFVFEMEDETIRSSLIPEIIAIARAVGSEVIAEGIETAAQEAQLRAMGVQYGQGYYFARPMGLADLQRFIEANAASARAYQPGF